VVSNVPIPAGATAYTYMNVGMDIDCRLMPLENGKVAVDARWDYNSLGPGQGASPNASTPVRRNARSDVDAIVALGKPTVVAEIDDVASTRRYEFEVKVAKVTP